ncbi:MAG: restriction endonuclease subunit S [Erysipelotrichaceae bacterium]
MKRGDIITPLTEQAIGLLGSTAIIPEDNKYIQSQDVAKIICKESVLHPMYAFYLISSETVKSQLSAAAQQTKIRHTSPDKIKDCVVWLPGLEEQKRIASILSALDNKIALNRAINQNLEKMAKQLYDYWFVQFDFPNEEGKPYKSSGGEMVWNEKLKREIPKGWEVRSLNSLITVKDGTHESPKQQIEGRYLITSKHLISSGIDYNTAYHISEEDYIAINKRSQVETNDILFSMIGTIGNKYLVTEKDVNFAIKNMALLKTSESTNVMYFLWLYLSSWDYKHYEFNAISGSIQKFLSLDAMRNIPVPFNYDIAAAFNKLVSNICQCITNFKEENIQLIKQRNELLPLLMNGQVSVNSDLSLD